MSAWLKVGLPLTALGAVALVGSVVSTSAITACSSSNSSSGSSSGGTAAGLPPECPASLTPGTQPPPNCVLTDESACGTPTTCTIAAECGSPSTCEPLAENAGQPIWNYRISALDVVAPSSLLPLMQTVVVTPGITLNLPQCGESGGEGSFTWLLQFNPTTKTLTTGGAPYSGDPINTGYCFAKTTVTTPGGSLAVAPVTTPMTAAADGSYTSGTIASLYIPIYNVVLNTDGGLAAPPGTPIVLPIHGGQITGMSISANGDCIGSFDSTALSNQGGTCVQSQGCDAWRTAGALGGYITLKEADEVQIPQLNNKSLCVALTQQAGNDLTCNKNADGTYVAKGDFCSTTDTAGGCADSFWLAATFAASAIKINDGSADPQCAGGSSATPDAGADTGSSPGVDSGEDTGAPNTEDAGDAAPE